MNAGAADTPTPRRRAHASMVSPIPIRATRFKPVGAQKQSATRRRNRSPGLIPGNRRRRVNVGTRSAAEDFSGRPLNAATTSCATTLRLWRPRGICEQPLTLQRKRGLSMGGCVTGHGFIVARNGYPMRCHQRHCIVWWRIDAPDDRHRGQVSPRRPHHPTVGDARTGAAAGAVRRLYGNCRAALWRRTAVW